MIRGKPVRVTLCPPQIPHGLPPLRGESSVSASAMARHIIKTYIVGFEDFVTASFDVFGVLCSVYVLKCAFVRLFIIRYARVLF